MASDAVAERNIKDRASVAFLSYSNPIYPEPESEFEPEPECEALSATSCFRRKSDLIEQFSKTLEQKSAQVHIDINAGMLNSTNPNIDFMQPMQSVNASSGLAYAYNIDNITKQAIRQVLELVTTDPTKLDDAYLTTMFTEMHQYRMGVLAHVVDIQKIALEKIN
jgi:hypothetical protein